MSEDWASAARQASLTAPLKAFCLTMWIIDLVALGAAIAQIALLR